MYTLHTSRKVISDCVERCWRLSPGLHTELQPPPAFIFSDRVSPSHQVAQPGLKLLSLLPRPPRELGLQVRSALPSARDLSPELTYLFPPVASHSHYKVFHFWSTLDFGFFGFEKHISSSPFAKIEKIKTSSHLLRIPFWTSPHKKSLSSAYFGVITYSIILRGCISHAVSPEGASESRGN